MSLIPKYCDTPEKVEEWKVKRRAYNKARHQTPEYKAYSKAYNKAYRQTPKGKAANKAYRQTPKGKAANKDYQQTPKGKAANKACKKNLRKQQSTADAFRMMQAASELAKALSDISDTKTQ